MRIRGELVSARSILQRVVTSPQTLKTAEGRVAAVTQLDGALVFVDDARRGVTGSAVLSVLGPVPVLGAQRNALVKLIDDSLVAANAGRALLNKVDALAERNTVRDGRVPVESLGELEAEVGVVGRVLGGLTSRPSTLWGPLGDARRQFDHFVGTSARQLTGVGDALGAARSFMAADAPRKYLVALQNNAEMRDQGAVLSYVVVRFADGRMSVERQGSILDLYLAKPSPTLLPTGTSEVFGPIRPSQLWQSVNATADFALSGRTMAEMYQQATGQSVDGIIAIDVPGLSAVLRVIGPVVIDAATGPITGDNVGRVLLHDLYQGLGPTSDGATKRERQADVVSAVLSRLTSGSYDAVALGRELGDAARGGHLRLFSNVAAEEQVFERTGLGGGPATHDADRTFHLAVENRTATKLDYYVKPSVRYEVTLTKLGTAVVRTIVTIDNQAPIVTTPSYQLGPDPFTKKPGDYIAWALLWGPAGSMQLQGGVGESGLNLSQRVIDVAAGQRREVTFDTVVPNAVRDGELRLRLVPQARLEPVPAEVRLTVEGWRVAGASTWSGVLDRVQTVAWRVAR